MSKIAGCAVGANAERYNTLLADLDQVTEDVAGALGDARVAHEGGSCGGGCALRLLNTTTFSAASAVRRNVPLKK